MENDPNIEHETEEVTTVYECQFCENNIQQFIPWSDKLDLPQVTLETWNKFTAICPYCFSMDRERMYRLYIEEESDLAKGAKRVLHIGNEPSLQNWLIKMENIQYSGGYVTSESGSRQLDMESLDYPDETFDAVICSHALQHVPDDLKAMKELHRVLKKDGWAIVQVPIVIHAEKINVDTIKVYKTRDFVQRLEKSGFTVKPINLVEAFGEKRLLDILRYGLTSSDVLYTVVKNKPSASLLTESVRSGAMVSASEPSGLVSASEPSYLGLVKQTISSFSKAWRKFFRFAI